MPKPKDNSTDKFLQRIAGKKALAPPPTPRPVIGEHPVRTLMRENRDDETPNQQESVSPKTAVLETLNDASLQTENLIPTEPPQSNVKTVSADNRNVDSPKTNVALTDSKPPEHYSTPAASETLRKGIIGEGERSGLGPKVSKETPTIKRKPEAPPRHFGAPAVNVEDHLSSIKQKYRLNSGEYILYRELYLMTHAIGKTQCSFVISEIMKSTGMLERRVRDNMRRLKKNGWIVLLENYDFANREKARYHINTDPII